MDVQYNDKKAPQDVMDAAMILTETCSAWPAERSQKAAPGAKLDLSALKLDPPGYVMHRDLCFLAKDPNGFYSKSEEVFEVGVLIGVLATIVVWLSAKVATRTWGFLRSLKQARARDAAAYQEGAE